MKKKYVWGQGVAAVVVICIVITVVLLLQPHDDDNANPPEVRVKEGILQGQWLPVAKGETEKQFAAFRGIPYAAPPIDELRFKAPRPPLPWDGKRDATKYATDCWQPDTATLKALGSEDCLYLNVYTPNLPDQTQKLKPVYFFIHGGTFLFGTDSYFGPEFLMLQDIVVVTIKYRLNIFGFLNMDTNEIPGNAGIKDQIAALQWVSQNIASFGGDPKQITVGGQSAGAVSAHWLALLPESRDLFQRVLLESGSALHSFGYNEDNFDVAKDVEASLASRNMKFSDIMKLPAKDIMDAIIPMVNERCNTLATQIPFAPSPERRSSTANEKPLIKHAPETYIIDPNVIPKPMFVGMNSREWLDGFYNYGYDNTTLLLYRINHLYNLIPKSIIPYQDTIEYLDLTDVAPTFKWSDVTTTVFNYYFQKFADNCDVICSTKKYLDDIVIGVDTNRLIDLRSNHKLSTTYAYRFGVRDEYSISPLLDPEQLPGGAVHSDELGYIWKIAGLNQTITGDTVATRTLLRMTNMWGSYVRTGIPSPDGNLVWRPSEQRKTNVIFLDIREELAEKEEDIAGDHMPFWFKLYQTYRQK